MHPWIPGTLKLDSILSLFKCANLFLLKLRGIGGSPDEPEQFLGDAPVESLLGRQKGKSSVSEGEPHLPPEHGLGSWKNK